MPHQPLDTICVGIALLLIGKRLGPLFILITTPVLVVDTVYTYVLPQRWRLMAQHPMLGVSALIFCFVVSVARPETAQLDKCNNCSRKSERVEQSVTKGVEEREKLYGSAKGALEEAEHQRKRAQLAEAALEDLQTSKTHAERVLLKQISGLQTEHRVLQHKPKLYEVAFQLGVEDYVSVQREHSELQHNCRVLHLAHQHLKRKYESLEYLANEEHEHLRQLKEDVTNTKLEMMNLPLVLDSATVIVIDSDEEDEGENGERYPETWGEHRSKIAQVPEQRATTTEALRLSMTQAREDAGDFSVDNMAFCRDHQVNQPALWARRGRESIPAITVSRQSLKKTLSVRPEAHNIDEENPFDDCHAIAEIDGLETAYDSAIAHEV